MDQNYKKSTFSAIILIVTTLSVYTLLRGINFIFTDEQTPSPTPTSMPSEFPDFEAYKSMNRSLVLAQNQITYSPKNQPVVGRLKKDLSVSGQFSRIYIYIEASVDNISPDIKGKPLSQWDSIYMTMNNKGGHLYRAQALKVPGDTVTRLLYGLNQVPVISLPYSENKTPIVANWFEEFNNSEMVKFDTFISSLRPGGKLDLVELRYECEVESPCEIK